MAALIGLVAVDGALAAKIDSIAVRTFLLPEPDSVVVVTPDIVAEGATDLPSVYLLHGYGGNHNQWLKTQPRIPELADQYGVIFVLPNGYNSWYFDSPDTDVQMETFITDELVKYIDSHYPTAATPAKRAITGFSMGGHGALFLAMRHPDVFGNAGSMSGGVDILPFPERWDIKDQLGDYNRNPKRWAESSVINNIERIKPGQVNIIFDCGVDDFFAKVNDQLHQAMRVKKLPHDYISRPGAHTHPYWANSLLYHMLYFDSKFNSK